jgi:hypothetical protein
MHVICKFNYEDSLDSWRLLILRYISYVERLPQAAAANQLYRDSGRGAARGYCGDTSVFLK